MAIKVIKQNTGLVEIHRFLRGEELVGDRNVEKVDGSGQKSHRDNEQDVHPTRKGFLVPQFHDHVVKDVEQDIDKEHWEDIVNKLVDPQDADDGDC